MVYKAYECLKCGHQFASRAKKPRCPKCQTRKVKEIERLEQQASNSGTVDPRESKDLYTDKDGEPLISKKSQSVKKKEEFEEKKEEKKENKGRRVLTVILIIGAAVAIGYFWWTRGGFNWRKPKPEEASQEPLVQEQEISKQAMSYISR